MSLNFNNFAQRMSVTIYIKLEYEDFAHPVKLSEENTDYDSVKSCIAREMCCDENMFDIDELLNGTPVVDEREYTIFPSKISESISELDFKGLHYKSLKDLNSVIIDDDVNSFKLYKNIGQIEKLLKGESIIEYILLYDSKKIFKYLIEEDPDQFSLINRNNA